MNFDKSINTLLDLEFPGLFSEIKEIIESSENLFDPNMKDSHLWEHTLNVSSITLRLAGKEKVDALPVVLAALFHDSGKFSEGTYHEDDIPEESASVKIAESTMTRFNVPVEQIETILEAINALYMEGARENKLTDIIHDADFLSKSGPLGIGEFFIKGAIRGSNLINRLINSASKELTYSENMASNMRTSSGRGMAKKDRTFTKKFFSTLFADLKKKGIIDLVISERKIVTGKCKKQIKIVTVSERTCENCGIRPEFNTSFESGIKCEKLILSLSCPGCEKELREISFCLPEICN